MAFVLPVDAATATANPAAVAAGTLSLTLFALLASALLLLYLVKLNRLLSTTPDEVKKLVPHRWTQQEVKDTYEHLRRNPITTASYSSKLPPRLNRRYIVTGGSGLVGGHIVLQLLERGQPSNTIRILDFQAPHRSDMLNGPAAEVDYQKVDISSVESTQAAFDAPWDPSVAKLPLTVFHTAAVIIASERSELVKAFCESVNVRGTENVIAAARKAGADVLVSTSSASISIRPVELWVKPWRLGSSWPKYFCQVLEESDFWRPIRPHGELVGNYPSSKAQAERIVCGANGKEMRTGSIRPANAVYGHPTDNTVGGPLNLQTNVSFIPHVVQSFAHAANCAVAHLQFEAILADPNSYSAPQAGRPFCVTDPNPPIYYDDLYSLCSTLAITPFRTSVAPPVPMLLLSYAIEWYCLLPVRYPGLAKFLPKLPLDVKYLQPALFSICTHLVCENADSGKPVDEGGLGYGGVLTTLDGMCQELVEWNEDQEQHARTNGNAVGEGAVKHYRNSLLLAEEIQKVGSVGRTTKA